MSDQIKGLTKHAFLLLTEAFVQLKVSGYIELIPSIVSQKYDIHLKSIYRGINELIDLGLFSALSQKYRYALDYKSLR